MFQASHTGGLLFRGSRKKGFCSWIRYRKRLSSCNSSAVAFRSNCTCPGSDSDTTAIGYPVTTDTNCSVAIAQGGAVQISNPGSDGVQGLQTLTMTNSGAPPPGATIVQYAAQSADGTQQFFVPGSQVVVQAATGDMPTYQIRTPTTALPQGVVMAASPGSLHSPQQLAEEATRKRELRLMKNREAARECRRKKKEYVKCLENRVAVLENQNKTLIEELKALKDLYCHKAE
ncbi:cAMP-responsive element modulator isoform X17 [Phascolarctos cinereus]|uniref:cAMP-responsive element modulator isoform X16 n=1 Tax=Phascolarctos cinereus TaxID=38626 RepID=A0A6P5KM53_PHACI|nr:cAMP-responsive element modulator isoform X16 [Phascolarctos cinereus]